MKQERPNLIRQLLEYKMAMRKCVQSGGTAKELKETANRYGFTLATPV